MKSIRQKIILTSLLVIMVALLLVGGMSCYLNYSSTLDTLRQTLGETVTVAAQRVQAELSGYKMLLNELAADISEEGITQEKCDEIAKNNNFTVFTVADKDGITLDGGSVAGTDYFQACKQNLYPIVTDPSVQGQGQSISMMIVAPILRDGVFDGIVIAGKDAKFLCDIVASIQIGNGNAAILNREGTTIAYADVQTVLDQYNTQKEVQNDPKLQKLADIEAAMCRGESGFGSYHYAGHDKFMAYTPVPNTYGWSIDVAVTQEEFLKSTMVSIYWGIGLSAVVLVVACLIMMGLANSIARPIERCVARIELLARGDLKAPVPTVKTRDETGVLAKATKKVVESLGAMLKDADMLLGKMAAGDFDITSQAPQSYVGDFESLHSSIRRINVQLSDTLEQVKESADQVASGSDQVSAGAQALSQGATEQASSVEELAATISEISGQVSLSAQSAREASRQADGVGEEAGVSKQRMQEMLVAMGEISEKSNEIGKIIKAIEDIAFQTNILALNAAVEAARAGEAGKGFAVVADEVRNLAGKSAEASKSTAELIEGSLQAVENGTKIADDTAKSLLTVVEGVQEVARTIDKISSASAEQAQSITQVETGVEQISAVVQTNSATAEQSAAASEELSGQSQILKELVGRFRLRNAGKDPAPPTQLHSEAGLPSMISAGCTTDKY